ncbi:MAG: acyl carrier protein [Myxococcota bacterium]
MTDLAQRRELLEQVRGLLTELVREPREPHQIDPDAPLFGSGLGLDSIDAVELAIALQQATGVEVPRGDRMHRALRTPNSLVDLVLELRAEQPS